MRAFYKKASVLFISFLLFFVIGFSQDVSGTWVGNFGRNILTPQPLKLVVEINLYNDSMITGMSHLYYHNNKFEHYHISGIYHKKDSTFTFKEDSVIAVKLGLASKCLGIYKTKMKVSDTAMRQEGRWKDPEFLGCPATTVWLEKIIPRNAIQINRIDTLVKKNDSNPNYLLKRETVIQKFLELPVVDKDSIKIEVYDNGIIDNDSVSVFIDDKEIIHRQMINNTPLTFYLSLDHDHAIKKIKLVAESLGSIPPCTAVMIITTKHKREEVSLSSNFNKNATVEFFLKE